MHAAAAHDSSAQRNSEHRVRAIDLTEDCVGGRTESNIDGWSHPRVSLSPIAMHGPCSRTTEQAANRIEIDGF
jgi:hypothetical protein